MNCAKLSLLQIHNPENRTKKIIVNNKKLSTPSTGLVSIFGTLFAEILEKYS